MKKSELFNLITLFILYFVQAMPYGFQSRYLPLILRKNGASISFLGMFKLLLIPWIFKFFIAAFVIDAYKTKRFWLVASMCTLAFGCFLGVFFNDMFQLASIIFMLNIASASQDICVDWFAINTLKKEDLGIGNTIQVTAFKLGTLFSGGFLVFLMDFTTISSTFAILAFVYLFSSLFLNISLFHSETRDLETNESNQIKLSFKEKAVLLHKSTGTYWLCIFVIIYKLGEQSALNFVPIYLFDQKISSPIIGLWTGIYGQSMSIFGSFLAGVLLKRYAKTMSSQTWLKHTLYLRVIPIVLLTFCIIYNENLNSALTDGRKYKLEKFRLYSILGLVIVQLFLSGLLTTFTFTLMMETSFLTPKPIQATHFSLLATFEVFGKLLFQPLIAIYTDKFGFSSAFIMFCALYLACIIQFQFRSTQLKEMKELKVE